MRALVTGATGFIGSHLVRKLVERGDEVRCLSRESSNITRLNNVRCEIVHGDLKDKDSLRRALEQIDVVYHAAAVMSGGRWKEHEEATVRGTERLLEVSLNQCVKRFVHISSIAVYGTSHVRENAVVNEDFPFEESPGHYRRAKIESEKLVSQFQEKGLPTVIIRPGIVFGPHGKILFGNIGYSLFGGRILLILGKHNRPLPLTYVDNTVDAIILAATTEESIGHAYNVVDGELNQNAYLNKLISSTNANSISIRIPFLFAYSCGLLVELLRYTRIISWDFLTSSRTGLVSQYRKTVHFDTSKAGKEIGWKPRVTLEEGLRETFWFYRRIRRV